LGEKCTVGKVDGISPEGRPKKTGSELGKTVCQTGRLNKEDAMDRGNWRK